MHTDEHGLVRRKDALAQGYTPTELQRMCAQGRLHRLVSGVYVLDATYRSLDQRGLHRLATIATVDSLGGATAASHISSAVLHGWDTWNTDLSRVHVTRDGRTGSRLTQKQHLHCAPLHADSISTALAVPSTCADRTIVDLARTLDLDHGVVIGDSALHRRSTTLERLKHEVSNGAGRTGIAHARRAIGRMNAAAESPGETLSRLRMEDSGMPAPRLQQLVRTPQGSFRVDFYWKCGVVGEFDGLTKYGGNSANLAAEKAREDSIRGTGLEVFRWTWADLWNFEKVVDMFERARLRANRAHR